MKIFSFFLVFTIIFLAGLDSYCQDIKGGFLTSHHVSGNMIEFELSLYVGAENSDSNVVLVEGIELEFTEEIELSENLILKRYSGLHTLPGPGMYAFALQAQSRISGIENIPDSENQSMGLDIETSIHPIYGYTDLPEPTNTPDQITVENGVYTFDPGIENSDPEQELVFSFVNCGAEDYEMPSGLEVDDSGVITFTPTSQGNYSVCLKVEKYVDQTFLGAMNLEVLFEANDSSVSVNEIATALTVYPNPSTDLLFVSLSGISSGWSYSLLDLSGRVVKSGNLLQSSSRIDVSELQKSIYLIQLTNSSQTLTRKVVVGN